MLLARHILGRLVNELRILKCNFIKPDPKNKPASMLIERRNRYAALFKAYLLFLRSFKLIMTERTKVQRLRTVSDDRIFSITKEPRASFNVEWQFKQVPKEGVKVTFQPHGASVLDGSYNSHPAKNQTGFRTRQSLRQGYITKAFIEAL